MADPTASIASLDLIGGKPQLLDAYVLSSLREAVWGNLFGDDVSRWYSQGFRFAEGTEAPWGLRQRSGGPCGVLAAVQGFVLYRLLFGDDLTTARTAYGSGSSTDKPAPVDISTKLAVSSEVLKRNLAHALAFVMWQAGNYVRATVVTVPIAILPIDSTAPCEVFSTQHFLTFRALEAFVFANLEQFETPSGAVLLMFSVLLSRGLETLTADMDEPTSLVARFGHCSQELLNLMLTGEAVTGVFDGEQKLSDGMEAGDVAFSLKGISKRPLLGFLSHAEAMRYSKVGDFYKSPLVPIWVIGSESHLTVLFSSNLNVNEESPSAGVYRIFKKYDIHDNQFIPVDKLGDVLKELGIRQANDAEYVRNLASRLDSSNMGFIVWADFWSNVSHILKRPTGASNLPASAGAGTAGGASTSVGSGVTVTYEELLERLRTAFHGADTFGGGFIQVPMLQPVIDQVTALLPPGAELSQQEVLALAGSLTSGQDPREAIILWEDLERQAETLLRHAVTIAKNMTPAGITSLSSERARAGSSATAGTSAPVAGSKRPRSDSEVARALQAEFDSEPGASTAITPARPPPVNTAAANLFAPLDLTALGRPRSESTTATAGGPSGGDPVGVSSYDVQHVDRTFELYHFNGLEDSGRKPRCVKLTARQSDTGLPPVTATQDTLAIQSLNGASAEDATAAAIALSALEAEERETAEALAALGHEPAPASASRSTNAGVPTPAASRPNITAFENIMRTKWPGVVISYEGTPPSLD